MRSSLSSTDRALDSQLALSLIGRDAPHDLIVNRDFVTRIGNLCDVAFVRKLNISFNRIRSLDGIDQLPQLKQLLAYACDIDSIECIRSTPKIETVFLQQNKISKMGDTFNGLSKLLELRLDQNKIIKIEYLNSCVSLRKLDLSFNNIENLSGLNGLQQLQELKLSNNNIKTLSSLKSLPSMRDLDVSNNQIKSLDGIQNIPTLEYIRADHNLIAEVKLLPLIGSNKTKFANDNNGSSSSKVGMDKKPSNTTSTGGSKKNSMTEVAALSGPMLSELSLTGNRIRSIHNLEIYKDTLELLDLSSNNLTATEINNIILTVQKCIKLTELRVYNNPICEDSAAMDKLILELSTACPALKAVDGLAIVANTDSKHSGQQARSTSLAEAYNAATAAASSRKGSTEFHTWNSSDSVAEDTINDANTTANEEEGEDDNLTGESDQSDNSDTELHNKKKKNADNTKENNKQPPPNPYHLQLKDMLTIEQIQEKELLIRNKLQYCKEKLENATLSIFGFTNETAEVEVPKRQEKPLQKELKMSESGKRVSAVLQEKEGQLSRQLSGVVSVEDTIVVEEGVIVSATSTSMKESLVNRVRLAVSSSNSSRANSSSNMKESADTKLQQQPSHSARSLPADDKSTPISMPTTTSSTTAARGIPGTLPNNPLLTDDLRASFELHRSLNNITSTTANNYSSSWSTARAEEKHESKSDSPTRPNPDTQQQPLSPDSHSVASKLSTGTSKSKPFLPAKQSALSKGSAVLGSGLTRHGTKIKQRSTGAEAKGGDGAHSPIEASVALLRAAGTDVESLDMLNLKITKQAGYTYLTEPVEDVGDEGSDPDHQEEHREEEGEYTEVDGERDEYGLPLDSIEEEGGEGDEVAMLPPPKELLFHEVTTRSDDRFGRALGGFGAAGYDPRRVHRATAEEMKSVEEIGRLRTPLAGTTDSLDVRSSGQKRLAEELARSMRRGHSAPNMDISEPSHLSITHEHSSDVPASPALSLQASSSATVSAARLPQYQHVTAAPSVTLPATTTTSIGSLSPRPAAATVSFASQPKLKFHLPQQQQSAKHENDISTTTNIASSTPRMDFTALEREILKASSGTIKASTLNPTTPLPYAPSGPFTVRSSRDYK